MSVAKDVRVGLARPEAFDHWMEVMVDMAVVDAAATGHSATWAFDGGVGKAEFRAEEPGTTLLCVSLKGSSEASIAERLDNLLHRYADVVSQRDDMDPATLVVETHTGAAADEQTRRDQPL